MLKPRLRVLLALLALSVVVRLVPYGLSFFGVPINHDNLVYPWNLSPILPLCIFGGAFYAQPMLAYAVPFTTFLLGDLGIWALTGRADWAFYPYQSVVYLSVALVATSGFALRHHRSWYAVGVTGLISSVGFFFLTNFGLWALGDSTVYPHTLAGLVDCYVRALPYFRNTLISMAVFLPLLFSPAALKEDVRAQVGTLASTGGSR